MRHQLVTAVVCASTVVTAARDTINVGPGDSIQAAIDIATDGDEIVVAPGTYLGPLSLAGKAITLRSSGGTAFTLIAGDGSHRILTCDSGEGPETVIEGFTVAGGNALVGGAMLVDGASPVVRDCTFRQNTADVGGAVWIEGICAPVFDGCLFYDNTAEAGSGAAFFGEGSTPTFSGCDFVVNYGFTVGALGGNDAGLVINCRFVQNSSQGPGGAATTIGSLYVNCIFSRNEAGSPLPATVIDSGILINCTSANNTGYGFAAHAGQLTLVNCVVWDNSLGPFAANGYPIAVSFSNIDYANPYPGVGNINTDPLFAQPGTDDLRLTFGSPCLDAGDVAALPADLTDLDGDGDTEEPIPLDLGGNTRLIGASVDMGAYEGAFEMLPAAWSENDLDDDEEVIMSPTGGLVTIPELLHHTTQRLSNFSGTDNATALVTEHVQDLHDDAGGYTELGAIMTTQTSLADGALFSRIHLPFGPEDLLAGAEPFDVDVTLHDPETGGWVLAVSANTVNSPGHGGPVGDRITAIGPGNPGWTLDVGDHGVFWNPELSRGYAWANVDYAAADFAFGAPRRHGDVANPPDGVVTVVDLLDLLRHWGHSSGGGARWDLDTNGVVGSDDLFDLLAAWGACR